VTDLSRPERLQPSLLDRLTDEDPRKKSEGREKRALSLSKYESAVMRDLAWLLNSTNLESVMDLDDYPETANSTLNYGIPSMSGRTLSNSDISDLERSVRKAILNFEPRIQRNSLRVRAMEDGESRRNSLSFVIEGELWAHPMPLHLLLRTDIDLETGTVLVSEHRGRED